MLKQKCFFYSHICIHCKAGHPVIACPSIQIQVLHNQRPLHTNSRFRSTRFQNQNVNFTFRQTGTNAKLRNVYAPVGQGAYSIDTNCLNKYLVSYLKNDVAAELLDVFFFFFFLHGFSLNYTGPRIHLFSTNLVFAEQNEVETLYKLRSEADLGRMLGPFTVLSISTLRINPIGFVPKSNNTRRLITSSSYPPDNSVNSHIDSAFCKVNFFSLDHILGLIHDCDSSSELGKVDIKSAFRL